MNVYLLKRVYSNGASIIDCVFSSKKKANDYLDRYLESVEKDGWTVVNFVDLNHHNWSGYKITPPSGNAVNAECFFIQQEEVL